MSSEPKSYRKIATEEAFATPEQLDAMREIVTATSDYDPDLLLWKSTLSGGPVHDRLLDLDEERIRIMDESGVDMHVLSLTSTGVQMMDPDTAVSVAETANDRLAAAIERHPGRFAGLATVAPQDPARAVREVERAIKTLELNGIVINSHTDGEFLSERKYWPILEAIEALGVPLYIHPRAPGPLHAAAYRADHLEHAIWGYHAETGLHALRLITGGIFDEFPELTVVIGHMGEGVPYWFYRIDYMHAASPRFGLHRRELKMKPSEYFRRNFMITTSGVNWTPPLKYCIDVLGADKIMFAVDYPYQEPFEPPAWLENADIAAGDKKKIFQDNALRVFDIKG